jgi:hypothetical protein
MPNSEVVKEARCACLSFFATGRLGAANGDLKVFDEYKALGTPTLVTPPSPLYAIPARPEETKNLRTGALNLQIAHYSKQSKNPTWP